MSSRTQRPVAKQSAAALFYILAIGSGIFRAFSVAFDVVAINTVLSDPISFGIMSQWVSLLVTICAVAFLSIRVSKRGRPVALGASLDPDFGRIGLLPKRPMVYLMISGLFAGLSTFFYYILVGFTDASTVLPYGQLVIIYLLVGDLLAEKDTPTIVEIHSILSILFGVLLVGVVIGGFDIGALLIVLGPMNIASAFYTYFQKKTKRYELKKGLHVDTLNMRVWSLLFLNLTMTIFMIPFINNNTIELMLVSFTPLLGLMVASSLSIFISLVMYVRALARGSMSVVNALSSISVLLGIPITLIGNIFLPGAFGEISANTFIWVLRVMGVILVMIGVISLQAADVRSLVFIKVKPQTGDILPQLFDIKGVEKAAAVAGEHDYILSIKSRSLTKKRSMILKKIQQIPEIEEIQTLIVIRDYR